MSTPPPAPIPAPAPVPAPVQPASSPSSPSSSSSSTTSLTSRLNLFFPNQYPREYYHIVVQNEVDVPQKPFLPFDDRVGIHPMFRLKAWRCIDFDYLGNNTVSSTLLRDPRFDFNTRWFSRMLPALQLASILIDRARPFFVHLYRADIIQNGNDFSLNCDIMPRQRDEDAYDAFLANLPQDLLFSCLPARAATDGRVINGTTMLATDTDIGANKLQIPHVGIAVELLHDVTSDDFYRRPSAQREVVWLNLAQLLLHEYAHVVWFVRNFEDRYSWPLTLPFAPYRPEPIIPPSTFSEVGFITSIVVFGCQPVLGWPVGSAEPARDGSAGIRALYLHRDDWQTAVFTRKFSAETIHSFFNVWTWQPLANGDIPRLDIHLLELTVPENSGPAQTGIHGVTAPNVPAAPSVVIQPGAPPTPLGPAGSAANPVVLP